MFNAIEPEKKDIEEAKGLLANAEVAG